MNNLKELKNIPYDAAYKIRKYNGNLEEISIDLLSKTIFKHAKKEDHILSIGCGDGNLEKNLLYNQISSLVFIPE